MQWAHYADNHHGMCLGFDVNDDVLAKIRYSAERVPYDLMKAAVADGDTGEAVQFLYLLNPVRGRSVRVGY